MESLNSQQDQNITQFTISNSEASQILNINQQQSQVPQHQSQQSELIGSEQNELHHDQISVQEQNEEQNNNQNQNVEQEQNGNQDQHSNQNQQHPQQQGQKLDEENFKRWLNNCIVKVFFAMVFGICFALIFIDNYKIKYTYTILIYELYQVWQLLLKHKQMFKRKNTQQEKKNSIIEIIETYMYLITGLLLIYYYETYSIKFIYASFPLAIVCILKYIIYKINYQPNNCGSLIDFFGIAFSLFLFIQSVSIGMKVDNIVDWKWGEVFWVYWIFFSVLIGFILGLLLMVVSKLCQYCLSEVESYEVQGIIWLFFYATAQTISSCLIILGLIDKLENNSETTLSIGLICSITLNVILLLMTIFQYKQITKFLVELVQDEDSDEENQASSHNNPNDPNRNNQQNRDNSSGKKKQKITIIREWVQGPLLKGIPTYLFKQSATYFKASEQLHTARKKDKANSQAKTKQKLGLLKKNQDQQFSQQSNQGEGQMQGNKDMFFSPQSKITIDQNIMKQSQSGFPSSRKSNADQRTILTERSHNLQLRFNEGKVNAMQLQLIKVEGQDYVQSVQNSARQNNANNSNRNQCSNQKVQPFTVDIQEMQTNKSNATINICLICFDKEQNAVILPCGHGGLCYDCSLDIWKLSGDCYLCRQPIKSVLQIDLHNANGELFKVKNQTILNEKKIVSNVDDGADVQSILQQSQLSNQQQNSQQQNQEGQVNLNGNAENSNANNSISNQPNSQGEVIQLQNQ